MTMSEQYRLEQIKSLNEKLKALLDAPEYGLLTWHTAVRSVLIDLRKAINAVIRK